jgi:hypothetical protein
MASSAASAPARGDPEDGPAGEGRVPPRRGPHDRHQEPEHLAAAGEGADVAIGETVLRGVLPPDDWASRRIDTRKGWYDLSVTVEEDTGYGIGLTGHVETGKDSISQPAAGGSCEVDED